MLITPHQTKHTELGLSNEELKAAEEDTVIASEKFDAERKELKNEIYALRGQIDKIQSEERTKDIQTKSWEEALLSSEKQTEELQEQVERLEVALRNCKADCESLQNEMDELKSAFDEASSRDRAEVMKELLETRSREVEELKQEVKNLTETNTSLSKTLKDTEGDLIQRTSIAETSGQLQDAQFEIQSLEGVLEETRKDLAEERKKVEKVRSELQDKISLVQKELETAETELEMTRSKLAEAEESSKRSSSRKYSAEFSPKPPRKSVRLSISNTSLIKPPFDEADASTGSEFYRSHALSRRIFSHKSRCRPRSCSPTTKQRLERDAEERTTANSMLQNTCDQLEDQNRMSASMKTHLEKEITQLQKQLKMQGSRIPNTIEDREPASDMILMGNEDIDIEEVLKSNDAEKIAQEFRSMAKKVSAQKSHNAELLTRILKLQGNIQVCCRIRPMATAELQKGCREAAQALSETELGFLDDRTRTWKSFAFDKVWGPETRQASVFQDVEPMVLSVVDGYNACIFAYGQVSLLTAICLALYCLRFTHSRLKCLCVSHFRPGQVKHSRWKEISQRSSTESAREQSTNCSVC
jgi:kinesin family protein C2/C3